MEKPGNAQGTASTFLLPTVAATRSDEESSASLPQEVRLLYESVAANSTGRVRTSHGPCKCTNKRHSRGFYTPKYALQRLPRTEPRHASMLACRGSKHAGPIDMDDLNGTLHTLLRIDSWWTIRAWYGR